MSSAGNPTHYEVLGISPALLGGGESHQQPDPDLLIVRQAYRRALLRNHPDKVSGTGLAPGASSAVGDGKSKAPSFTIDQISLALAVLSSPARRRQYDRELQLQSQPSGPWLSSGPSGNVGGTSEFQTGLETVDLDDLDHTEPSSAESPSTWTRACRCGNPRGFVVRESDLEEAAEEFAAAVSTGTGVGDGPELAVGCEDCSLWIRVKFAVVEDAEDEGTNGVET